MRPWIRYSLIGAAGAVVGALIAVGLLWRWMVTTWVPVTDTFVVAQAATWISATRSSADSTAYEDALRAYLSVLDTAIVRDSAGVNVRMLRSDKALTLVRMADLAARRNAQAEALALRQEAEALCPVYGLNPCNADALSDLGRKLDTFWSEKGK